MANLLKELSNLSMAESWSFRTFLRCNRASFEAFRGRHNWRSAKDVSPRNRRRENGRTTRCSTSRTESSTRMIKNLKWFLKRWSIFGKKLYKNEKLMYFGLASLRIASLAWSLQLFIHYIYVQMRRKHIQTYFYIFTTETSLK